MPSTQGFPSCAESGLGGQVLPHLGGPQGDMPYRGQLAHQGSCPWLPWRRELASAPTPATPGAHRLQNCLDKEPVLLSSLSALLGTCLSPLPPPLPCLSSASHTNTHMHMRAHTCSHMLTHIHVATCTGKRGYPCSLIHRDTCTLRDILTRPCAHSHTKGLGRRGTRGTQGSSSASRAHGLYIDSQALCCRPPHTPTHTHTCPPTHSAVPPLPSRGDTPHAAPAEPPAPCQTQRHR